MSEMNLNNNLNTPVTDAIVKTPEAVIERTSNNGSIWKDVGLVAGGAGAGIGAFIGIRWCVKKLKERRANKKIVKSPDCKQAENVKDADKGTPEGVS